MRLQLALDFTNMEDAVRVARPVCREGLVDIVEAGTPLIKSVGILSVSRLRIECPGAKVMADTKTADVGALEARMAIEAGAHMASVLGSAANETILDFVRETRELGGGAVVDMVGIGNPVARVRELAAVGIRPSYINLHLGVDVQRSRGLTIDHLLSEALEVRKMGLGVMVAGGINEEVAPRLRDVMPDIVVVGRGITRSSDPVASTRRIREILGI
jgi:3-hexulose-6-phosphate synthase